MLRYSTGVLPSRRVESPEGHAAITWQAMPTEAKQAQEAVPGFQLPFDKTMQLSAPLALPQDVWLLIFQHLAASLEPDGLRGPGVVAADIVGAGMTCRDMYHGSRSGLQALAKKVVLDRRALFQPPPPDPITGAVDWPLWDRLLCRPMDCSIPELAAALKQLKLEVPPTKPEKVQRLLQHFGLTQRCPVPVRVWVAMRQEQCMEWWRCFGEPVMAAVTELQEVGEEAVADLSNILAFARRQLYRTYGSTAALLAAHRAVLPLLGEQRRRREAEEEEQRRRAEEHQRQWAELFARHMEEQQGWAEEPQGSMALDEEWHRIVVQRELGPVMFR